MTKINKHTALMQSCEKIGFNLNHTDFRIITKDDGTQQYIKLFNGGHLEMRSPSEIIFKPLFIRTLKEHIGEENIGMVLYKMTQTYTPERTLLHYIDKLGN